MDKEFALSDSGKVEEEAREGQAEAPSPVLALRAPHMRNTPAPPTPPRVPNYLALYSQLVGSKLPQSPCKAMASIGESHRCIPSTCGTNIFPYYEQCSVLSLARLFAIWQPMA